MIEHGHADPAGYTPAQVQLFIEAIWRRETRLQRQRLRDTAQAHRIATYDKDDFTKAMRKLKDSDE